MNIYEIKVRNYPEGKTEVSKVLDPMFDAKLLLEGVGVIIPQIIEWSKTKPKELKESAYDLEIDDVIKMLQEYLEVVGRDYETKMDRKVTLESL